MAEIVTQTIKSKRVLIPLIFIFILVILLMSDLIGILYFLDPVINRIIPDIPSKFCQVDSDCVLAIPSKLSECSPCDPYGCKFYSAESDEVVAINKNWKPRCLFSKPKNVVCIMCIGGIRQKNYQPECVNNECIKVKK